LYKEAKETGKNCIIESIRAEWEALALKWKDKFYLFSIDADPKIRYERVVLRWSETDKISYEEFIANEKREMENTDPTKQNLSKCMALSDHIFTNDWTLEELNQEISKIIKQFWI
jgi:dephospho-CoA kinase